MLLRPRGERRSGRNTAEKGDHFASSHCHPRAEERAIVTIKSSAQEGVIDVRFGSEADMTL